MEWRMSLYSKNGCAAKEGPMVIGQTRLSTCDDAKGLQSANFRPVPTDLHPARSPCQRPPPPGNLCGVSRRTPPLYDHCIAPFRYEGALPHLVTGLKFRAHMNYARLLGALLLVPIDFLE